MQRGSGSPLSVQFTKGSGDAPQNSRGSSSKDIFDSLRACRCGRGGGLRDGLALEPMYQKPPHAPTPPCTCMLLGYKQEMWQSRHASAPPRTAIAGKALSRQWGKERYSCRVDVSQAGARRGYGPLPRRRPPPYNCIEVHSHHSPIHVDVRTGAGSGH